ncbi:hypothetical protein KKA14_16050 [bacterium]|nr:hypothetical protein [bacterium]
MAKKILEKSGWNNVPVYVGLIDAVPNTVQNELETAGEPIINNPFDSGKYCRRADLAQVFSGLNKPTIYHIVGGGGVILQSVAHAFCADVSWYDQTWVDLGHVEMGRCGLSQNNLTYNTNYNETSIVPTYEWVVQQKF